MKIAILLIVSYLLGSIPTGYIVTTWMKGVDVRKFGSGNVGATNVTRVMGLKYGALVAFLDIMKGFIAVLLTQMLLPTGISSFIIFLAGLAAIVGHDWSVFLKFSGGKGVATTAGVILRILPMSFIFFALIWLLLVFFTRYVSLASIIGVCSLPVTTYFYYNYNYLIFGLILAFFVIYTHRENIQRLLAGEENKMGWPPKVEESDSR